MALLFFKKEMNTICLKILRRDTNIFKFQKIVEVLNGLKLKKGNKFYSQNLLKCYKNLILHKILDKKEYVYLNSWLKSLKKILN